MGFIDYFFTLTVSFLTKNFTFSLNQYYSIKESFPLLSKRFNNLIFPPPHTAYNMIFLSQFFFSIILHHQLKQLKHKREAKTNNHWYSLQTAGFLFNLFLPWLSQFCTAYKKMKKFFICTFKKILSFIC